MRLLPAALVLVLGACRAALSYGEAVDPAAAVPLAEVLSGRTATPGTVVVSGRIGEICAASGCWFALQDRAGPRDYSILVDLKPAATFTVPASLRGRSAIVKGRLAGGDADRRLDAVGLLLR